MTEGVSVTPQPSSSAQVEQSAGTETWVAPVPESSPPRSNPLLAATDERPEIAVGAAFAVGFLVAKVLRSAAS